VDKQARTGVGRSRVQSELRCGPGLGQVSGNAPFSLMARQRVGWCFAMDGRLVRGSAECRRDWSGRRIVPATQKCFRTGLKIDVLSGFPTALDPTLPRSSRGTNASTLRSDRKAAQFLLRLDDLPPPPPFVVALGVCRLRLAGKWFLRALRHQSRVLYGQAGQNSFLVGSGRRS